MNKGIVAIKAPPVRTNIRGRRCATRKDVDENEIVGVNDTVDAIESASI